MRCFCFSLWLILCLSAQGSLANKGPTLVDLLVTGTVENPVLEISQVELLPGEPYLFVMINQTPQSVSLQFEKFGLAVFTQHLQGTPNVSQDGLMLLPDSKVLWDLITNDPGEYVFSLINNQTAQVLTSVKLTIKPVVVPLPESTPQLLAVDTQVVKPKPEMAPIKPEEKKPLKRRGSSRFIR